MPEDFIKEKEEGFKKMFGEGHDKCNCPKCRTKRGEKLTLSKIRHDAVSEMRRTLNRVLKQYKHGIDGWAIAVSCLEDSRGMGLAESRFAKVGPSRPGIRCAAHLAGQAISEIMHDVGCNQADAEQIFRGEMLEALHATLRKKDAFKMPDLMPDLLKDLLGLSALMGEPPKEEKPSEEKPAEEKPAETPKEPAPVNLITQ